MSSTSFRSILIFSWPGQDEGITVRFACDIFRLSCGSFRLLLVRLWLDVECLRWASRCESTARPPTTGALDYTPLLSAVVGYIYIYIYTYYMHEVGFVSAGLANLPALLMTSIWATCYQVSDLVGFCSATQVLLYYDNIIEPSTPAI